MPRRSVRNRKPRSLDLPEEKERNSKSKGRILQGASSGECQSRKSTDPKELLQNARSIVTKPVIDTETEGTTSPEEVSVCCKCQKEDSPVNEGKAKNTWIDCDICGKWWHGACARLSDETVKKLIAVGIKYSCAFCVLGESESLSDIDSKLDKVLSLSTILAESHTCKSDKSVVSDSTKIVKLSSDTDKIVILDQIASPKEFRSSDKINKELSRFPETQNKTERAYCLPQGGVALHLKEGVKSETFIKEFPVGAFGKVGSVHQIRGGKCNEKKTCVAYAKNIPVNIHSSLLKASIDPCGDRIVSVHRLRYSRSGKVLPVIRVTFKDFNYYQECCSKGIHIPGTKQKKTLFEPERRRKVIRCYNCHRFGHIGKICLHKSRCLNCGKEECASQDCMSTPCCANCGGNHKADSSHCPTFLSISRKFKVYSCLQN